MSMRSVPAPFLMKTYRLVDDPITDDVISWNESGRAFVVWKTADFVRDLLPNYFKHNNFSSFIRQLNTYGFRKIVADKWEFANENFRRGSPEMLSEIRRKKAISAPSQNPAGNKPGGGSSSPSSNSGQELGSSYTSSPDSKNPGLVETSAKMTQLAGLSVENEKLKNDNEMLSSELEQAKKQCDQLVAFLTKYAKVGSDQINRIMRRGSCSGSNLDGLAGGVTMIDDHDDEKISGDDDDDGDGRGGCGVGGLKLFGVLLQCNKNNKKRARDEKIGFAGPHAKGIKISNGEKIRAVG